MLLGLEIPKILTVMSLSTALLERLREEVLVHPPDDEIHQVGSDRRVRREVRPDRLDFEAPREAHGSDEHTHHRERVPLNHAKKSGCRGFGEGEDGPHENADHHRGDDHPDEEAVAVREGHQRWGRSDLGFRFRARLFINTAHGSSLLPRAGYYS